MMMPNVFRAASLALSLAFLPVAPAVTPAHAGGGHDILLQFEFGEYRYPEAAWAAGGISCRGGSRIVDNRGFSHVRPLDCRGRTFTYLGWWHGDPFRVFVDSAAGRIIGVGPS